MIVSGLLNPFLANLDFFDSSHALASICKLEDFGYLAILAILGSRIVEVAHFRVISWVKDRSKSSYIGRNFEFSSFLVSLG